MHWQRCLQGVEQSWNWRQLLHMEGSWCVGNGACRAGRSVGIGGTWKGSIGRVRSDRYRRGRWIGCGCVGRGACRGGHLRGDLGGLLFLLLVLQGRALVSLNGHV